MKWYHLDCFRVPKNFGGFNSGLESLKAKDKKKVKKHIKDPANRGGGGRGRGGRRGGFFPAAASPSKVKGVAMNDEMRLDQKKMDVASSELSSHKIPELKDMLRTNDQKLGGKKAELVTRVADGILWGRLPMCPSCGGGKFTLDGLRSMHCRGFYDDERPVRCSFSYNEYAPLPETDENYVGRSEWEAVGSEVTDVREATKDVTLDESSSDEDEDEPTPPPKPKRKRKTAKRKPKKPKKKAKKKAKKKKKGKGGKKKFVVLSDSDEASDEPEADYSESDSDDVDLKTPPRRRRSTRRRAAVSYADDDEDEDEDEDTAKTSTKRRRRKKSSDDDEFVPAAKRRKME